MASENRLYNTSVARFASKKVSTHLRSHTRLFEYGFLLVLFIGVFILWFPKAYFNDLYFDEAAAWHVATSSSVKEILTGAYTHVGDMPLSYLLMKPWFSLFRSEFGNRFLFIISSWIGLLYAYRSFRLFENRYFAALGTVLLALSPLYGDLSVLIRSYIIGTTLQIIAFYYFCRIFMGARDILTIVLYGVFALTAAFSAFSSLYLLIFFLIVFLVHASNDMKNRRFYLRISVETFCIFAAAALWIYRYVHTTSGQLALMYYVGYGARNLIGFAQQVLLELVLYVPYWNGFWPNRWFMNVPLLEPAAMLFSFCLALLSILGAARMGIRMRNRQPMEGRYLFAGAAVVIMILSLICSLVFTNVLFARLVLFLLLPWMYGIITLTKFLIQKRQHLACGVFLGSMLLFDVVATARYWQLVSFPTETVYQTIVSNKGRKNLVIMSEFTQDLLDFYEQRHRRLIYQSTDILYTSKPLHLPDIRVYDKIFYFGYYDMWQTKNAAAYQLFQTKTPVLSERTLLMSTNQVFFLKEFTPHTPSKRE